MRRLLRRYVLTLNTIRYRIELRILEDLINTIPEKKLGDLVLDAGAGSGEMSRRLHEKGYAEKLIGVEPSPLYKLLQQNYASSHFETIQASLEKIPMDDARVDGVLSTQVFEHIEDHEAAASEVSRVLKSGGYALISTPHPPEMYPNDEHMRPGYTVEEMRDLFEKHGFEFLDQRYFCVLSTLRRLIAAQELGLVGKFLPQSWADREAKLSQKEMFEQQPYGIACLFRKK